MKGCEEMDEQAVEQLIEDYGDSVLRICYLYLKDYQIAYSFLQVIYARCDSLFKIYYLSLLIDKMRLITNIPAHGIKLLVMPTVRLISSAIIPIIHGITIAPIPAIGSIIPMLVTFISLPTPATATGLTPAIENAKMKSIVIVHSGLFINTNIP